MFWLCRPVVRFGIGLLDRLDLFRDPERFLGTLDEFRVVPDLHACEVAVVDPQSAVEFRRVYFVTKSG